jgi:hypothetical protein
MAFALEKSKMRLHPLRPKTMPSVCIPKPGLGKAVATEQEPWDEDPYPLSFLEKYTS